MTKKELIQKAEKDWYFGSWRHPAELLSSVICEDEKIFGDLFCGFEKGQVDGHEDIVKETYHIITNTRYLIFEVGIENSEITSTTLNNNSKISCIVEEYTGKHSSYRVKIYMGSDDIILEFSSEDFAKNNRGKELRDFMTIIYQSTYSHQE